MTFRGGRWSIGAAIAALALAAAQASPAAPAATRWIVFSAEAEGTSVAQLFRVQTTGAGIEQITKGALPATDPAFSPDGKQIVFVRLGSGIFRVNLDGTGLRRLTSGPRDSWPVWAPDGKHIAFIRIHKSQWRVYLMSPTGGNEQRLKQAPPAGRPSWSSDGKSLLFPAGGSLAKVDARTGRVEDYYDIPLDPAIAAASTIAPNQKSVAFIGRRAPTGAPDCGESHCPAFALYLAGVPKGKPKRLVNDTGPAGWSPDGKTLVFVSRGALTFLPVGGGKRTTIPLGTHVAQGDAPPAWQPR